MQTLQRSDGDKAFIRTNSSCKPWQYYILECRAIRQEHSEKKRSQWRKHPRCQMRIEVTRLPYANCSMSLVKMRSTENVWKRWILFQNSWLDFWIGTRVASSGLMPMCVLYNLEYCRKAHAYWFCKPRRIKSINIYLLNRSGGAQQTTSKSFSHPKRSADKNCAGLHRGYWIILKNYYNRLPFIVILIIITIVGWHL